MFGRKKGPDEPFAHAEDCKIVHADPQVQIPWSEIRRGVWEARCVCGVQYHHDPITDDRMRFDPLDPNTARHSPLCEFVSATDPSVLRAVLRVTPKDGYSLGRVQFLRLRLAGSALRRERRETTTRCRNVRRGLPVARRRERLLGLAATAFSSVDRSLGLHAPTADPSPWFERLAPATSTRRCLLSIGFVILAFLVGGFLGSLAWRWRTLPTTTVVRRVDVGRRARRPVVDGRHVDRGTSPTSAAQAASDLSEQKPTRAPRTA